MDWLSFFVGMALGGVLAVPGGFIVIVIDPDWF